MASARATARVSPGTLLPGVPGDGAARPGSVAFSVLIADRVKARENDDGRPAAHRVAAGGDTGPGNGSDRGRHERPLPGLRAVALSGPRARSRSGCLGGPPGSREAGPARARPQPDLADPGPLIWLQASLDAETGPPQDAPGGPVSCSRRWSGRRGSNAGRPERHLGLGSRFISRPSPAVDLSVALEQILEQVSSLALRIRQSAAAA